MQGASLEEAHEQLLARVRRQFARHPDIVEEQEAALAEALHLERAQREMVSYWRIAALKAGRPDWYVGAAEGSRIWADKLPRPKALGAFRDEIDQVHKDITHVLYMASDTRPARVTHHGVGV